MNEFCVNPSLQEFKETQWRLNISAGELEGIVRQYYRETGSDESFPSDPYILRALIGQNTESYQEAVELWKERFSSSRVFKNQEDAEAYKSMAEDYFAPESVLLYKTHEGNFIVRVAKPGFENYTAVTPDEIKSASRTERGKMAAKACADFLNHFGISIGDLTSFKEFLKEKDDRDHFNPFEVLIKEVNGKSPTSIINGTAKAIAFLMQWSPEMIMFATAGQYDLIQGLGKKETKKVVDELSFQWQNKRRRNQLIYDLSLEIAKQLKEYYSYPDKFLETEKKGKIAAVWEVIKAFFRQFNPIQKARARFLSQFSIDIVKSIINNDPTFVLTDNKIPFKQEDVVGVELEKLFKESPLEAQLIKKLNDSGFALGGSIALAIRNMLNRTSADLHDIDVEAPYPMTSDEIWMSLAKAGLHPIFFTTHKNKKSTCYSYIISDQALIMQKNEKESNIMDIYNIQGKKVGFIKDYDFTATDDSFKGYVKCLDVFSYSTTLVYPKETFNIGGTNYLFASPYSVVSVKGDWARPKDVFDFTHFTEKFPDFSTVLDLNKKRDSQNKPYDNSKESRRKWLIANMDQLPGIARRHPKIRNFYDNSDFSGFVLVTDDSPYNSEIREEDIASFYNAIKRLGGNPLDFEIVRGERYSPHENSWKSVMAIDLPHIDNLGNRWTYDFKLKYKQRNQELNDYYNQLSQDERLSRYALAMQEWEPGDPIPELNKKRDQSQEAEAIQKEMQEIKAKAIADGTFMKAPNGKKSNLTESQWLQVRTKAFKKWFGDWLSFNKSNPYSTNIHIGEFEDDFSNADASGIGKVISIFLGDELIGESGFDNSLNGSSSYLDMPSVGGSNITIEKEYRGKGYGKAAYFEIAKLAANNGKILRSAPDKSRTPASTRVWESLKRDGYARKVEDRYEFINSSLNDASKVVDENGEPLVVYHGSTKRFTTFDTNKTGSTTGDISGFYFTNNRDIAEQYYSKETGSAIGNIKLMFGVGGKSTVYDVFLKASNPYVENFDNNRDTKGKENIIKNAKEQGHDVVVLKNIIDGPSVVQNVYVVFNSNQIKSATDNNGMFSNDSLSILKKKRDTVNINKDGTIGFLFPDTLYSTQVKEEGNPTLEEFATQEIDGKEYKFSTLSQAILFRAYNETIKALKELEKSQEQKALIKDLNKMLKDLLNEKKITLNFNELNKKIDSLLGENSIENDLSFAVFEVYSPIVERFRTLIDNKLQGGKIISFTQRGLPTAERNAYKQYFKSLSESALWRSSVEVSDSPWIEAGGEEAERIQKLVNKYHKRQSKDYVRESSLNANIKGWLKKGEDVALVDVIQAIVEKEKNKYYKLFAQILQPLVNEAFADKKVAFVEPEEGEDFEARILKKDLSTIQVNKNSKSALNTFVSTILHETIHLLTITKVDDSLKPVQEELYTEIDKVRVAVVEYIKKQFAKDKLSWSKEDIYGLTSTDDFISEFFTNRNFQKFLDSIKIEDVQKGAPIQGESVFQKVIKAVKDYLDRIFKNITKLYGTSVFEYLIPQMMDILKDSALIIIKDEDLANDAYKKTMDLFKNTIFGQTSYIRNSLKQSAQLRAKIQSVKKIPGMSEVDIMRTVKNLAYTVSDLVTFIMTNPEQARKFKDTYRIDPTKSSRQEVINTIGLKTLFSMAQQRYLLKGSDKTFEKRDALSMRMPVLILLATPHLKYLEGVIPEITLVKDENSTEAESDREDEADENTTESWQIETRTVPIENSLSKELNLFLSSIREKKKVVKDKQEVIEDSLDEFGMVNRERRQKVMNVLLNIVSGSKSMQEMITKLEEARDEGRHLWLDQVINMLKDNSGRYYIEQAQFFTVFNRHRMQYIKGGSDSTFSPINSTTPRKRNYNKVVIGYTRNISQFGKDSGKKASDRLNRLNGFLKYFNSIVQAKFENSIKTQHEVANKYGELLNYLGITKIDQSELQASITDWATYEDFRNALSYMVDTYEKGIRQEDYDPFAPALEEGETDYNIIGYVKQVLFPYTSMQEDLFVTSVSSNGKMYQGFILPTYTTTIMQGLMSSGEEFIDFITEKYANNEWFRDQNAEFIPGELPTRGWRNPLLHLIATDTRHKRRLDHAQLLEYNQLQYMKTMLVNVFNEAVLKGFFSGRIINNQKSVSKETTAWYPIPIMANKPSGEFIRFTRFIRGLYQQEIAENTVNVFDYDNKEEHKEPFYKKEIAQHLQSIFKQEVIRIHTVKNRKKLKNIVGLKNFDENGLKFVLLPFFNSSNTPDIIKKYIETGKVKNQRDLDEAIQNYIIQSLNKEAQYYIENIDSFRTIDTIPEISKELRSLRKEIEEKLKGSELSKEEKEEYIKQELDSRRSQLLENFYFNNYLVNASLQELFIIDPAFNKNTTDLQKRLLQIHSSGQRMYTEATDRYGNKVSDGVHRAIIIKTEKYQSDIYDFIKKSFMGAAERFTNKKEKEAYLQWVKSILEKYKDIDVTDGQALTCPSAMKKKLIMAGQWNDQMEDAYQNIMQGNYSVKDLKVIMQPLKPFSYSFAHISTGIKNNPNQEGDNLLETLDVPMQYKDAEYMLFISDALRSKEDRKSPNFLEALFDFMESTYKDENGQYKIEDGHIIPTEDGIDTILFDSASKDEEFGVFDTEAIAKGKGTAEEKEEKLIKELKKIFKNYRKKDNSKEIVKETSYSDYMIQTRLPAHFADQSMRYPTQFRQMIPASIPSFYYDVNGKRQETKIQVGDRLLTVQEFSDAWDSCFADLVQDGIDDVIEEFGLSYGRNSIERNTRLSAFLINQLLASDSFSLEALEALTLDENGDFYMPIDDTSSQSSAQKLILSAVRNRINRQKVPGGALVQVANYRGSQDLHIIVNKKTGGIDHYQVIAPASMKKLFKDFALPNGDIDFELVKRVAPELLQVIVTRIPTEGPFSASYGEIVDFAPPYAGEIMMLPKEVTLITGDDNDSDKQYTMIKKINVSKLPYDSIVNSIYQKFVESLKDEKATKNKNFKELIIPQIEAFVDGREELVKDENLKEFLKTIDKKDWYVKTEYGENTKYGKTNRLFDMAKAVLQHPSMTSQILSPQGFDNIKRIADEIEGKTNPFDYDPSLANFATHLRFYNLNQSGGNLLSIFASDRTVFSTLSRKKIKIILSENDSFKLGNRTYSKGVDVAPMFNQNLQFSGNIIGNHVGAAADVAKEDALGRMGFDGNNINIYTSLLKIGVSEDVAAKFINQPILKELYSILNNSRNVREKTALASIKKKLQDSLNELAEKENKTKQDIEEYSKQYKNSLSLDKLEEYLNISSPYESIDSVLHSLEVIRVYEIIAGRITPALTALGKYTKLNSSQKNHLVGPDYAATIAKFKTKYPEEVPHATILVDGADKQVTKDRMIGDKGQYPMFAKMLKAYNACFEIFDNTSLGRQFDVIVDYLREVIDNDKYLEEAITKMIPIYQTMLLCEGNHPVINGKEATKFLMEFPTELYELLNSEDNKTKKLREKLSKNAFINSLDFVLNDSTGNIEITFNYFDYDRDEREIFTAALNDLINDSTTKEIAIELIKYNILKNGIGFSPLGYGTVISNYGKRSLDGYNQAFKNRPSISPYSYIALLLASKKDSYKWLDYKKVDEIEGYDDYAVIDSKKQETAKVFISSNQEVYRQVFDFDEVPEDLRGIPGLYKKLKSEYTGLGGLFSTQQAVTSEEAMNEGELNESDLLEDYEQNGMDLADLEEGTGEMIIGDENLLKRKDSFADDVPLSNEEIKTAIEEALANLSEEYNIEIDMDQFIDDFEELC